MKKALVVCHMGRHYRKFGHYDIKLLQKLDYEVHFAANFDLDIDKVEDNTIVKYQINFNRFPFSFKNYTAYKQLKKVILDNDYDIIHCQSPVGGVLTRLIAIKNRKKMKRIIYTAHGFHFYKGSSIINWLLFYPIEKLLAKYTDTLITINKEDYQLAQKKFSKRCKDIQYMPGIGIDIEKYKFNSNDCKLIELKRSIGLDDNDFVLIYVARLEKNKNQMFLIKCMKKLEKNNKKIHLLLVGQDGLSGSYNKYVKKNQIHNIHFLGFRNDIVNLLKISDLAVSASFREGLPLNIMEAMASGLPVIALKCRGVNDLIINNKNGFIIKDENEFISKVFLLKDNIVLYNKMKQNNINDIVNYDITNTENKFTNILNNKLRRKK